MITNKYQKLIEDCHKLMFEKERLETFNKNWRELKGFKKCNPENFANAGFYNYSSKSYPDNVKCFACQKELNDWEVNDDPWEEHMKRGNKCPYVVFRSKENTTVKDFLQLNYEIKKIILNSYFDEQKKAFDEKEKLLLQNIDAIEKMSK